MRRTASCLGTTLYILPVILLLLTAPARALPIDDVLASPSDSATPGMDPFQKLVEPPKRDSTSRTVEPVVDPQPQQLAPPPLVVKVRAIAGENETYVAVIDYKGEGYLVERGWKAPDDSFSVRSISAEKLELFSKKEATLRTFYY